MIPGIEEINFPTYATLTNATATLSDMGDKVISTQIKIDGDIVPNFVGREGTSAHGEDWEIEFEGERYIHPLRKPQALKDNSIRASQIDLTFQHWAIYQMRRYLFVSLANVESGRPIADKYIADLAVNLEEFATALENILKYYFPNGEIYVFNNGGSYVNPDLQDYDKKTKYVEINHSYIWDVLQKTYELFECHWTIGPDGEGNYVIKFGYPVTEHQHVFEYGHEGGLISVERQVQDDNIRNQLLGRGGEKNLPYMYFKDYEKFHPNSQDSRYTNQGIPDPDAIPELELIYFSELRDKNFRSYIQGWKVNPNRQLSTEDGWSVSYNANRVFTESDGTTYSYDASRAAEDWAYAKGASDEVFDPVEYVKDDESIETYGLLQGGLENNEDVYPTIQDMKISVPCIIESHNGHSVVTLADEVVEAEKVQTDEINASGTSSETFQELKTSVVEPKFSYRTISGSGKTLVVTFNTPITVATQEYKIPEGFVGNFVIAPTAQSRITYNISVDREGETAVESKDFPFGASVESWYVEKKSGTSWERLYQKANIPAGTTCRVVLYLSLPEYRDEYSGSNNVINFSAIKAYASAAITCTNISFNGVIIENGQSTEVYIAKDKVGTAEIIGDNFAVPSSGGAILTQPVISIDPFENEILENTIIARNVSTEAVCDIANLSEGTYRLEVKCKIKNNSGRNKTFTVTLNYAMLNYIGAVSEWKPTFDIWIKNIFGTSREDYSSDDTYVTGVWGPLRTDDEMAVTFTTGNLSRHSDWEFKINTIAYDNSKTIVVTDDNGVEHEVRSEWRLTLIKSDAEADAIHKYVPYENFDAAQYDRFLLSGIALPWAYVYAAEALLNAEKEAALLKSKDIQPDWAIRFDKTRIVGENSIANGLSAGDKVWVKDSRFTQETGIQLFISSITYRWDEGEGIGFGDIEVSLSDKVETSLATVAQMQSDISDLSTQVRGLSDVERSIRRVGDVIYLRKDGFDDTSYSPSRFAKQIASVNFRQGVVGGEGWSAYSNTEGEAIGEFDKLYVRKELHVNDLVINQVSHVGGKEILSAANMVVERVEEGDGVYNCYFDQKSGSIANLFAVDDIAMSQIFDPTNNETKFYRRRVVGVGVDYISLSMSDADGEGVPSVGDVIVQYGNYTDARRQFVIIRDVIGGGFQQMLYGLNSVNAAGTEYYFAGADIKEDTPYFITADGERLQDSEGEDFLTEDAAYSANPKWFIGSHQGEYAKWENGELTIKGRIVVKRADGGYSDIGYLNEALEESEAVTTIDGGIILSKIIGVQNNGNLVAGFNASSLGEDSTHGTLMLFAGADDAQSIGSASFRVFADGTVFANKFVANAGCDIGDFHLDNTVRPGNTVMYGSKMIDDTLSIRGYCSFYPQSLILSSGNNTTAVLSRASISASPTSWLLEIINRSSAADLGISGSGGESIGGFIQIRGANVDHYGLRIETTGDYVKNVGIKITSSGSNSQNYAILAESGMYGGLRLPNQSISGPYTADTTGLTNVIIVTDASQITLPASPQDGQMFFVVMPADYNVTINGNGKNIRRANVGTRQTQSHSSFKGIDIFIFSAADDIWYMTACVASS